MRRGGGDALKRSIANRTREILTRHGIAQDLRPKGPTLTALRIVLETVGISAAEPRNYLRPKQVGK